MFDFESFPKYKAAAVQAGMVLRDPPEWFDMKASLDKAISLIGEASRNGARLIVFPELWLPGHPSPILAMAESGPERSVRGMWVEYLKHAMEVPGPEVAALCRAAKKAGAYVVMGFNERDTRFYGAMYNSVIYIGPQGEVLGVHRKIVNTAMERLFQVPGEGGANLRNIFATQVGRVGGSICCEYSGS